MRGTNLPDLLYCRGEVQVGVGGGMQEALCTQKMRPPPGATTEMEHGDKAAQRNTEKHSPAAA